MLCFLCLLSASRYIRQRTKYFHIWAGRVAFLAGAVQCYRGVELVSSADTLIFSALDIDIEVKYNFCLRGVLAITISLTVVYAALGH